jgi:protein MpaA
MSKPPARWLKRATYGGLLLGLFLAGCRTPQLTPVTPSPTQPSLPRPPTVSSSHARLINTAPATAADPGPEVAPPVTVRPGANPSPALTATPTSSPTVTRPRPTAAPPPGATRVIGRSIAGRPIISYQFGRGPRTVVFVGGIHGGYEWNTILLAYQALDYFLAHPRSVPPAVTLYLIPSANPDGQVAVTNSLDRFDPADLPPETASGRFNLRQVDLNRNWDCQWAPTALWQDQEISGGRRPFSEPETRALRDFFLELRPELVLFWHSAADGVYASGCPDTDLRSRQLAQIYGRAAGYPVYDLFEFYPITGDAGSWLTTQGVPSFTVELKDHQDTQWSHNLVGVLAILDHFAHTER